MGGMDGRLLASACVSRSSSARPSAACPCVASSPFFAVVTPVSAAMNVPFRLRAQRPAPSPGSCAERRPAKTSLVGIYPKADTGTRGS
jgi:hypothetical protein